MKKLLFFISLYFFACSKKADPNPELDKRFRELVISYQKTYPVKNTKPHYIYVYNAAFGTYQGDTFFSLSRSSSGIIPDQRNLYGLYHDEELQPFIIFDTGKFSFPVVKVYKQQIPDSVIWKSRSGPESFTPIAYYKLINGEPRFIKVDTVWKNWD
jgi:hypothetical protein